jgi:hypothetical protein
MTTRLALREGLKSILDTVEVAGQNLELSIYPINTADLFPICFLAGTDYSNDNLITNTESYDTYNFDLVVFVALDNYSLADQLMDNIEDNVLEKLRISETRDRVEFWEDLYCSKATRIDVPQENVVQFTFSITIKKLNNYR